MEDYRLAVFVYPRIALDPNKIFSNYQPNKYQYTLKGSDTHQVIPFDEVKNNKEYYIVIDDGGDYKISTKNLKVWIRNIKKDFIYSSVKGTQVMSRIKPSQWVDMRKEIFHLYDARDYKFYRSYASTAALNDDELHHDFNPVALGQILDYYVKVQEDRCESEIIGFSLKIDRYSPQQLRDVVMDKSDKIIDLYTTTGLISSKNIDYEFYNYHNASGTPIKNV